MITTHMSTCSWTCLITCPWTILVIDYMFMCSWIYSITCSFVVSDGDVPLVFLFVRFFLFVIVVISSLIVLPWVVMGLTLFPFFVSCGSWRWSSSHLGKHGGEIIVSGDLVATTTTRRTQSPCYDAFDTYIDVVMNNLAMQWLLQSTRGCN